ncbi:hypothetical protein PsorP6_017173 [Peronosclerospora sorghi]|uniref:Uncharacterized protein n=1 Tax=Peronosclerospora sorghi TaxID=230839 RepID=A0ACC0WDY7_9STRA|nr:hypothetical protein PsorP6_017173 [Peronosclerospora sorghi]
MKLQCAIMVAAAAVLLPSTTLAYRSTEPSRSLVTHDDEKNSTRLLRSGAEVTEDEERMKRFLDLFKKEEEAEAVQHARPNWKIRPKNWKMMR